MFDYNSLLLIESKDKYPLIYIPDAIKNYIKFKASEKVDDKTIIEEYNLYKQDKQPIYPTYPQKKKSFIRKEKEKVN